MVRVKTSDRITVAGMPGQGKSELARALALGSPRVFMFDPMDQYGDVAHAVRVVPAKGLDEKEALEPLAARAMREGNVLLIVEEAEIALGEPYSGILPEMKALVLRGRNRGVGLVAVTRRVANLSKTVFGLSEHVFLFKHFAPNDLEYLNRFIGKEWGLVVSELPEWHFLHYSNGQVDRMPPLDVPGKGLHAAAPGAS